MGNQSIKFEKSYLSIKMKYFLISFLLYSQSVYSQIDSTKQFYLTKGTWTYPIEELDNILNFDKLNNKCASPPMKSIEFISSVASKVKAVHSGKVVLANYIDSIGVIIFKFGDYYFTYSGLDYRNLKKNDVVFQNQVIGVLQKDFDEKYRLDFFVSLNVNILNPENWFIGYGCP